MGKPKATRLTSCVVTLRARGIPLALGAFFISAVPMSSAHSMSLHLVCLGKGSANKTASTTAFATNSQGQTAWGQVVGTRAVPFDDQVNVELSGSAGKIRMPRTLLPAIHGGDAGWMEIKHLKISDQEITGSVGVNFANHPKLRIDRLTGTISIDGRSGHYTGDCQAFDPKYAKPKF